MFGFRGKDVDKRVQAELAARHVRSLSRFAAMADARQQLREFCRDVLRLDQARDAVRIAAAVDTWEASSTKPKQRQRQQIFPWSWTIQRLMT